MQAFFRRSQLLKALATATTGTSRPSLSARPWTRTLHVHDAARIAATLSLLAAAPLLAQTTAGLITGRVTDPSGAVVAGAKIDITNQGTGLHRSMVSGGNGIYLVPQLEPGNYNVSVTKEGFATENRTDVALQVNQSVTLDFALGVSSTGTQQVTVTGAPPALNTTSSTLSNVIDHAATVELPLNGREFTQLTLLTPGAAPVQAGQQGSFTVALGSGGISPSVNGQRGEQNNFTMDGVLNNATYTNTWIIAPPPDAIQEFNVQSHITDAQFSISSGANINLVTRSGTNAFHGALWEFLRNDALDAQTFPETERLPYRQNQYGVYLGGPIEIPHLIHGINNTWFSGYWEGFRSAQTSTTLSSVPTQAMVGGDFSQVLGAQVGVDSLNRPEYANQIYDPLTSRPDPAHPGEFLRDPFPGNQIPVNRLNSSSQALLGRYYPLPNLNVPAGTLPNYAFSGTNTTASDVFGIRFDHNFRNNDTMYIRFNRANAHLTRPESLPTYNNSLSNYGQQAALGYTHIFNPSTLLNFHYAYSYVNFAERDDPAGVAFNDSINFTQALPPHNGFSMGPEVSMANGYSGLSQAEYPLGPQESMEYHLDLSKTIGSHTITAGGLYYHIRSSDDSSQAQVNFTQNGTAQNALPGPTGFGPASFLLGVLDSYSPQLGNTAADQTVNWYGVYAQDQWQVTPKLVLTAGLRWDYVSPPNYHKIVSGLNVLNGQFIITGAAPPYFAAATGSSGYFEPQYNGFEPRFGLTYRAMPRTVLHGAFAMLDDHNNTLVQENQNLRLSFPSGVAPNLTSLDLGLPQVYLDSLPSAESFLASPKPYASYGANPNNKIPYSMEYNAGVQQQISDSMVMKLDYVGSVSRHQYIVPEANTAVTPGPGPISARQPFPQYGGPFSFSWNAAPASYNALQLQVQKTMSNGLFFLASYTWSKSMDWQSDPYTNTEEDFYNLRREWGPSDYNRTHMFVLSGVYTLPIGHGKALFSHAHGITETLAGGWNIGTIVNLNSGAPFNVTAGGDIANTGSPSQRAERTGVDPYDGTGFHQTVGTWLNKSAFAVPASYTFGNENRNDLVGPTYRNVDLNLAKTFSIKDTLSMQFRAESFNLLNVTNYSNPDSGVQDGTFGQILTASGPGRQIQFSLKAMF